MPELSRVEKQKVISGRKAVDAYREAHRNLYEQPWRKTIPEEHTPLLNTMLADLKKQDFNSLDEFFTASDDLNLEESGLKDKELTETDRQALEGKWH